MCNSLLTLLTLVLPSWSHLVLIHPSHRLSNTHTHTHTSTYIYCVWWLISDCLPSCPQGSWCSSNWPYRKHHCLPHEKHLQQQGQSSPPPGKDTVFFFLSHTYAFIHQHVTWQCYDFILFLSLSVQEQCSKCSPKWLKASPATPFPCPRSESPAWIQTVLTWHGRASPTPAFKPREPVWCSSTGRVILCRHGIQKSSWQ